MKVANHNVKRPEKDVSIQRADGAVLTFRVRALPLGFDDRINERLPLPSPPREYATDRKGRVLKDQEGKPLLEERKDDPSFRAAFVARTALRGMMIIHEALKADPNVSWETKEPTGPEAPWPAFYSAIFEEVKEAGYLSSDLAVLLDEITAVSSSKAVELFKEKREGF